jgi:hypothetical protein
VFTGYISSARIVVGTAVYTSAFTPPTAPLTAVSNTSLLCNFTNAGIYDAAMANDLETVGNAQISTTQSKWGGGSMYFDGSDYITVPQGGGSPQNINWEFGGGAFTVEFWVYVTNAAAQQFFMFHGWAGNGGNNYGWRCGINSSGQLEFYANGFRSFTDLVLSSNTWHHVAVCGTGAGVLNAFLDGVKSSSTPTYTSIVARPTANLVLGGFSDNNELIAERLFMTGYISDLRILKGVAILPTPLQTSQWQDQ